MIKKVSGNTTLNLIPDLFVLNTNELYLQCQTGGGAIIIMLPRITALNGQTTTWGFKIYVNDVDNNASVNNITIMPHPANKINGSVIPVTIDTNGGTGLFTIVGLNNWLSVIEQGGGSGEIHFVTYAQLIALSTVNALSTGHQYVITDFRTREIIPNTIDVIVGGIEPIITTAVSSNKISSNVLSTLFPEDEILYELINTTTSGDDRGRIYFRLDTNINVSTWYNWRVIKFRRWETAPGSGIFTILTDNGNNFIDSYTFNNSPIATNSENTEIDMITNEGIALIGAPSDKLNNIILNSSFIFDNQFANDCFNNTLNADDAIVSNRIKSVFAFNVLVANKLFVNNNIGIFCFQNSLGDNFSNNNIEQNFMNNSILDGFSNNDIHDNFSNNTIGELFGSNSIEDNFYGNIIGDRFVDNEIQDNFYNNIINNDFHDNNISNGFHDNIGIGNNFNDNVIYNDFNGNSNIGNDFQKNHIESGLSGVDFSAATIVYGDYTKDIFKNNAGNYRLSYTDNADTIQYANPNS